MKFRDEKIDFRDKKMEANWLKVIWTIETRKRTLDTGAKKWRLEAPLHGLKKRKVENCLKYMENLSKVESCNKEQEKLEQSRDLEKY